MPSQHHSHLSGKVAQLHQHCWPSRTPGSSPRSESAPRAQRAQRADSTPCWDPHFVTSANAGIGACGLLGVVFVPSPTPPPTAKATEVLTFTASKQARWLL
eukprot:CAMPEP_0176283358 /NCGR_PEP_ID=MMETSP0121_2-20121125/51273_1 /TAXON_ID=160619 /ORGANISM="Kryptoperidinium foliaceum, Strain CCMP 1326" /LENGTH=100 /DNA_ID=CAMNT_0017623729 /DNA_START=225 /DNA_END=527 /DNA_ORIENTATION=+